MKILITGGCGFIGTNFIYHIINKYKDYKVINFDKLTYAGNRENLKSLEDHPNYEFVIGDICDAALVNDIVKDVDTIVHLAAESHVDRSIWSPSIFIRTNVIGTHNLLEAARRNNNKRFHHVSTDEVFGSLGKGGLFNETSPYNPRNPYSASKAASDHLVRAYFHTYNLPITINNCSNNYGQYQYPEKLIPLFITHLIKGKKVPVYGDGLNIRDWIHVKDHCDAIDLILHKGKIGETYCIGGDCEKTNIEITNIILKKFNKDGRHIKFVKDRKGHDRRYSIDITKIKNKLGWHPKYTFDEGLNETIRWYEENIDWWQDIDKKKK